MSFGQGAFGSSSFNNRSYYAKGGDSSDGDDVQDMVQRNIQDVLHSVRLEEEQLEGTSAVGLSKDAGGGGFDMPPPRERQGSASARPSSGRLVQRPSSGKAQDTLQTGPSSSSSMLDVPGHAEATIRLHKARIKALEEDVGKLTKTLNDKEKQLNEALKELKVLKTDQAAWGKSQTQLKAQVDKYKKTAADAEAALAAREQAFKEMSKQGSMADREKKVAEAEVRSRDVRLQHALEEVEKYKQLLMDLKNQERDSKDVVKSDLSRLQAENKRLERQRAELLVAFKKQLRLVDVLKRQKLHLEAARALQFTEEEFLKTLDMGQGGC